MQHITSYDAETWITEVSHDISNPFSVTSAEAGNDSEKGKCKASFRKAGGNFTEEDAVPLWYPRGKNGFHLPNLDRAYVVMHFVAQLIEAAEVALLSWCFPLLLLVIELMERIVTDNHSHFWVVGWGWGLDVLILLKVVVNAVLSLYT